ncbi:hypothetical protein HY502_00400 [Candidatus Woesebacteria bacterium]|nr:hypothetical protein [Candidatus Woesebacteria bacterium]
MKSLYVWATVALGLGFLLGGLFTFSQGRHTRGELIEDLLAERLNVADPCTVLTYEGARAPEGVEIPKVDVDTAEEADCQARVIRTHTLALTDGKTYSELPRDDPGREFWFDSLTIQTPLHVAHVGLELTLFAMGVGVAFSGLGAYVLVIGVPFVRKIVS